MAWNVKLIPSQKGRVAIVTGANIGLGFETALELAKRGAEVILACRNPEKAKAAQDQLRRQAPQAKVSCMSLDLSRLESVRQFAAEFQDKFSRLDLLINNAGIMMPPYQLTEDGFESQLGTNYIGHFALTGLLLPLLEQTENSRIVNLSSVAHRWGGIRLKDPHFKKGYNKRKAYGQSKLACLMFSYELQRRLDKAGYQTISVAAHPGVSFTNLGQYMPKVAQWMMPLVTQSAANGAQPTLYAALGEDINGGDYCGPNGLQEWRGKPVKVGSNRASKDKQVAGELWQASEEMSGISYLN